MSFFELIRSRKRRLPLRLAASSLMNTAYILFNLVYTFEYSDVLLFLVALYYAILVAIRLKLYQAEKRDTPSTTRRAVFSSGILLFSLALVMCPSVALVLVLGPKKRYDGYSIIPQAVFFTFCLLSLVRSLKCHKTQHAPILEAADRVSLSATLFSLFNLGNYVFHAELLPIGPQAPTVLGAVASLITLLSSFKLIGANRR